MTEASGAPPEKPFDPWSVVTPKQADIAKAFLADRERDRHHLVVYLSGAHAYGFPSPDSDLDLKCVHVAPTSQLVGLGQPNDPPGRIDFVDGVELDYSSNELSGVLRGALKGNGNYLERLLGDLVLAADQAMLDGAREVIRPTLSRRVAKHYVGFAVSQLRAYDDRSTAKRALYVFRTAATGRHLLETGQLETDLTRLRHLAPTELDELLAIKKSGEQAALPAELASAWRERLVRAIAGVDQAVASSTLPPEPSDESVAAVDSWLRTMRRARWD